MASSHLLLWLLSFLLNDPPKAVSSRHMHWVKERFLEAGGSFVTSCVIHLWNLSSHLMPHDFMSWYWTKTISHSKRIIRKSACCSFDTRIIPRVTYPRMSIDVWWENDREGTREKLDDSFDVIRLPFCLPFCLSPGFCSRNILTSCLVSSFSCCVDGDLIRSFHLFHGFLVLSFPECVSITLQVSVVFDMYYKVVLFFSPVFPGGSCFMQRRLPMKPKQQQEDHKWRSETWRQTNWGDVWTKEIDRIRRERGMLPSPSITSTYCRKPWTRHFVTTRETLVNIQQDLRGMMGESDL